jgi:hypothetical protein
MDKRASGTAEKAPKGVHQLVDAVFPLSRGVLQGESLKDEPPPRNMKGVG